MLDALKTLCDEYNMLDGLILCAISGGADSMCLVHYLHSQGHPIWVAHYDHQIRGDASLSDAQFVETWCRAHDIPCTLGGGDVPAQAKATGQGLEETARVMRYAFLEEVAQAVDAKYIATAHHADDNAETLLLHLIRGTGLQGLTGIPPRRGKLIRPLLTTSRAEILDYLDDFHIPHVEDATNDDITYTRNRLRHQVMPVLRELNPNLTAGLGQTLAQLRRDNDYLNAQAMAHSRQAKWVEDSLVIQVDGLARQPDPVATRVARQLLAQMGEHQVSSSHLEALVSLSRSPDPSALIHLPHSLVAQRVYDLLELCFTPEPPGFDPVELSEGETQVIGDWRFTLKTGVCPQEPDDALYFERAKVEKPFVLRPRRVGDSITLPNRGTKTLKKLLIDSKYPRKDRDDLPLLVASDHVVYIPGFGPHAPDLAQPGRPAWVITAQRKKD